MNQAVGTDTRQIDRQTPMKLSIPQDIVRRAEATRADIRIALAVQLYADNRIDHADACELARLSAAQFNRELLARGITIQQYPPVDISRREAG